MGRVFRKNQHIHLFLCILTAISINGCDVNYYLFDGSPDFKKNQQAINRLSEMGVGSGMYVVKQLNEDSTGEIFKNSDYKNYKPPVLPTAEDSMRYIQESLSFGRLVDIQNNGKEIEYQFYCYINAAVFDDFFLRNKKSIPDDDSTLISAKFIGDTLCLYRHSVKNDADSSLFMKKSLRKAGDVYLINSPQEIEEYTSGYFSVVDSSVYSVRVIKDSSDQTKPNKLAYEIRKIVANKETISFLELLHYSDSTEQHIKDSIIGSFGLKVNDRIIEYNEAGLTKIFESPIATVGFDLQKLHNFPSDKNIKSENNRILLYVLGGILLIFGIVLIRRKKQVA